MKRLLIMVTLCLGLLVTVPAMAAVDLGLPQNQVVNFDGNGVFDKFTSQTSVRFDSLGPTADAEGAEYFGIGTMSDAALGSDLGKMIWVPTDQSQNFEMRYSFFNAIVDTSQRIWTGTPGQSDAIIVNTYKGSADFVMIADSQKEFSSLPGPGAMDLATGAYPDVYTLPAGTDPTEEQFLKLSLSNMTSTLVWRPGFGFVTGAFAATDVNIVGGSNADKFVGNSDNNLFNAFLLTFRPTGWAFGGDVDVTLTTVPEPATLVFLGTGLASLVGYRLRRRMA